MPLRPETNPSYWPLLLTDDLYLLSQDLVQQQEEAEAPEAPQAPQYKSPEAPAPAAPAQPQAQPQPDLLWGSLQRGVVILVDYPQHPLLERTDGLFLVEILKAVGFDFKDVATLNVSRCKTDADWHYARSLACKWIISFGVNRPELPFTQQAVSYQQLSDGDRVILFAENLSAIRADVSRKKQLWNLLKQAFV
jgi:hypothetical protein